MGVLLPGLCTKDSPLGPARHERKFFGACVWKVTLKHLPQPLRSHIRSFGTLGQLFKISPFTAQNLHSSGDCFGLYLSRPSNVRKQVLFISSYHDHLPLMLSSLEVVSYIFKVMKVDLMSTREVVLPIPSVRAYLLLMLSFMTISSIDSKLWKFLSSSWVN